MGANPTLDILFFLQYVNKRDEMNMEIEKIKITDITPAEYNPRKITDEEKTKLRNSLNTFGVVDPIIINMKNMHIIGGHQRYETLLDMYMENNSFTETLNLIRLGDIGWVFPDTDLHVEDEDHEKALNLALNKINGEWDIPKLNNVLDDLSLKGFDTELTGFDDLELTELQFENDIEYDENKDYDLSLDESSDEYEKYYEPKVKNHEVKELYTINHSYDDLISSIDDEELQELFRQRVAWFTEFNFSKIADYYAYQATPNEQRVFEKLVLVLFDKNECSNIIEEKPMLIHSSYMQK